MPLPALIEIVPLEKPVRAEITVPGSKSITNRALILAALGKGATTLQGALWSEDTQVMVEALQKLGFEVTVQPDPEEFCNRLITVTGLGGRIPNAGTQAEPLEIFVGNAGTAARFLPALVCLGQGSYRFHGVPRMHERPQAALFEALRELGYRVDSANNKLPAVVRGAGPRAGKCQVSIEESSQFASGLLLCAPRGGWQVKVVGENAEESPYVTMTSKLIETFPRLGGTFQIEPDASSGSYFFGAAWLLRNSEFSKVMATLAASMKVGEVVENERIHQIEASELSRVSVKDWPSSRWQIDSALPNLIFAEPASSQLSPQEAPLPIHPLHLTLPGEISREHDLGDSIMTAAVLAPFMGQIIRLTDLRRLRLQETERVTALRTELTKCGAKVLEQGDTLTIIPSRRALHGAEIETYNDHRMAMCFTILGLKVPGIKIKNPACVRKTFPNFFQKLAADPPHGLGVAILDATTGGRLRVEELFAE